MNLVLERPLIFHDLETTGTNPAVDRIVELGAIKINPDKSREVLALRFNPGINIPTLASDVHGITNEMVVYENSFDQEVHKIIAFYKGCDIAGYNSNNFDNVLLAIQLEEQGFDLITGDTKVIDVMNIFKRKEGHSLAKAYEFYVGGTFDNAHSAIADIEATIEVFAKQIDKYEDLDKTVNALALYSNYDRLPSIDREGKFVYNENNDIVFTFGKNRDLCCKDCISYMEDWLETDRSNFSDHVKDISRRIRNGEFDREKNN